MHATTDFYTSRLKQGVPGLGMFQISRDASSIAQVFILLPDREPSSPHYCISLPANYRNRYLGLDEGSPLSDSLCQTFRRIGKESNIHYGRTAHVEYQTVRTPSSGIRGAQKSVISFFSITITTVYLYPERISMPFCTPCYRSFPNNHALQEHGETSTAHYDDSDSDHDSLNEEIRYSEEYKARNLFCGGCQVVREILT